MNNNLAEKSNIIKEGFGKVLSDTNIHTESYINLIYPLKIIKRVLFRPYLGRWYPYIDVYSPGYDNQLSFFYGKIGLEVSNQKLCCKCYKELNNNKIAKGVGAISSNIPISLCRDCISTLYRGYWDCLGKILGDMFIEFEDNIENKALKRNLVCEDLLNPRCDYPTSFDSVNPCLKTHGIGLIILNKSNFEVVIGTLESIRYQMIWKGGIFGLIFGYSNKILNLETLSNILQDFKENINQTIEEYNSSKERENFDKQWGIIQTDNRILISCSKRFRNSLELEKIIMSEWFFLNILNFYTFHSARKLIRTISTPLINILEYIIKNLFKKLEYGLELLDIIELYQTFTPLTFELRAYFEDLIIKWCNEENFEKATRNLLKNFGNVSGCVIPKISDKINMVNLRNECEKLNIYEIMSTLGPFMILKSDNPDNFSCIHLNNLIGGIIR